MMFIDRSALVTGASRGIGKAIALQLQSAGIRVIGTATTQDGAQGITTYLSDADPKGVGMVLDVTDPEAIKRVYTEIQTHYGAPLILINNAGITRDNLMLRMKPWEWDAVLTTNLHAIYHTTQACLKAMTKARWGRIVNIASVVASTGNPGQANYCAAKSGMIGFTKSLAAEMASRNITCNAIAPGFIDTDMVKSLSQERSEAIVNHIPMKRLGKPEDIGQAVLYLISADYVTGTTMHVNGGMYMP